MSVLMENKLNDKSDHDTCCVTVYIYDSHLKSHLHMCSLLGSNTEICCATCQFFKYAKLILNSHFVFTHTAHRGRPAAVALLSALHADLGVAVGRVEPARLLPLLSLLQELEWQPCGHTVSILLECKCRDSGRNLHVALVPWLLADNGVPVGVTRPVALQQEIRSHLVCFL